MVNPFPLPPLGDNYPVKGQNKVFHGSKTKRKQGKL